MPDEVTNQELQAPIAAASAVESAGAGSMEKPSPEAVSELSEDSAAQAEAAAAQEEKVAAEAQAKAAQERSEQTAQDHYEAMHERARALVAAYEHGMETNSPRTMAELNELKAMLFGE